MTAYNSMRWLCLVFATLVFLSNRILALGDKDRKILLDVKINQSYSQRLILNGHLRMKHSSNRPICFYLPMKDENYHKLFNAQTKLALIGQRLIRSPPHYPQKFQIKFTNKQSYKFVTDFILQIQPINRAVELVFSVNYKTFNSIDSLILDHFHPIPLTECPSKDNLQTYSQFLDHRTEYEATIENPDSYTIAHPNITSIVGNSRKKLFRSKSLRLSFALLKNFNQLTDNINGIPITIFFQTNAFLKLRKTLLTSFQQLQNWLGSYPFAGLIIIETKRRYSSDMAGIITLNQARQKIFQNIQSKMLNWYHWAIVNQLCIQWFGTSIRADRPRDLWLLQGLNEFLTYKILQISAERFNLFNNFDANLGNLLLDFRQLQDLSATILRQESQSTILTNSHFISSKLKYQHPLLYIRHAISLRFLDYYLGEDVFKNIIKSLTTSFQFHKISPMDFASFLNRKMNFIHPLENFFSDWWFNGEWPDFELSDFSKQKLSDTSWIANIKVKQLASMRLPVSVRITDKKGDYRTTILKPSLTRSNTLTSEINTPNEPAIVELDPERHLYDSNRFNNTNQSGKLYFFPGSAKELKDDGYTLLWLPYPFRQAGENLSLGISAILFRYLNSNTNARLEMDPKDKKLGYKIYHHSYHPEDKIQYFFSIYHDYDNHRVLKMQASHIPIKEIQIGSSVNEKRIIGSPHTAHTTFSLIFNSKTSIMNCHQTLQSEAERSIFKRKDEFNYIRSYGVLSNKCQFKYFHLRQKMFRGRLNPQKSSTISTNVMFQPRDPSEAGLRIDQPDTPKVKNLMSMSTDISFPFSAPLPDSTFILKQHLQWKLFYDIAYALDRKTNFSSYGLGLIVPFGGDIANGGSLAISSFSFLLTLRSVVGDTVTKKPSILFDLTGEI